MNELNPSRPIRYWYLNEMWVERNGPRLVSAACLLFCPYLTGSCLFISADDQGSGWACYLGRSGEGLTFPLNITESGVGREARSQTHTYLNESLQSVILMHWITWRCAYLTYIILLTYILFPCCALSLQHTHTHTHKVSSCLVSYNSLETHCALKWKRGQGLLQWRVSCECVQECV